MLKNLSQLSIKKGGKLSPLIIPSELTKGNGLCNASIFIDDNGDISCNIRHVHYTLYHSTLNQKFNSGWGCLAYLNPEDDLTLTTGNYLCKLDPDTLYVKDHYLIDTSARDITPVWEFVGLEDGRIFKWDNKLYICGVRRDTKSDGEGRMELCELQFIDGKYKEVTRDRINPPSFTHLEKNWMPILDMPFHFVRWCNPLEIIKINPNNRSKQKVAKGIINIIDSEVVIKNDDKLNLPLGLRGSSQVIPFGDNGDRICVTHETHFFWHQNKKKDAHYYHRFVIWDKDWKVKKVSEQFKFMDAMIEFACGLIIKDDNFIISYGYQDNAAYALKMPIKLLDELKWDVYE